MLVKEKLTLNYYKDQLKNLLIDKLKNYNNLLINKLIEYFNDLIIDNELETNEKISILVKEIINQPYEFIIKLIDNLYLDTNDEHLKSFNDILKNTDYVWEELIQDTKFQRIRENCHYQQFPFNYEETINLQDIITPLEIIKEDKLINNLHNNLHNNFKYETFYKIFENEYKNILIKGKSGIGKTIQIKYLLYNWSKNKWKTIKDKLIMSISLKNILSTDDIYDIILKQNFKNIRYVNKDIIQSFLNERNQDLILFVDDLNNFDMDNTIIWNIINCYNNLFTSVVWLNINKCNNNIYNYFDKIFQLFGFNYNQIISLSKKFVPDNPDFIIKFKKLINKHILIRNVCKIPKMAILFIFIFKRNESLFNKNLFEIYEYIIQTFQKFHNFTDINFSNLLNNINKFSFINLTTKNLTFSSNIEEEKDIIKLLSELIIINNEENSNFKYNSCQFYHLSFQEYFSANYLIDEFQNFLKRVYWTVSFDNQLIDLNDSTIYNIIEFIRINSIKHFKRIYPISKRIQKIYDFSENIQNLLEKDYFERTNIQLENEKFSSILLSIIIERIGNNLTVLTLISSDYKLEELIDLLCNYSSNLTTLFLSKDNPPDNLLEERTFLYNLCRLISKTNLDYFQLGRITFKIKRKYIDSCRNIKKEYIQELSLEDDAKNIYIEIKFGKKPFEKLIDKCSNFSKFITYNFMKFIKECHYLKTLHLENKTLLETFSQDFLEIIHDLKEYHSLKYIIIQNLNIQFSNESYMWNCFRQRGSPKFQRLNKDEEKIKLSTIEIIQSKSESQLNLTDIDEILMDNNQINDLGIGKLSITYGLIHHTQCFKSFNFDYCDIQEIQAKILGNVLQQCSNIEKLSLDGNRNMGDGFFGICKGIKTSHRTIKYLSLRDCNLTDTQGKYLGKNLRECYSIESLILSHNGNLGTAYANIFDGLENSCQFLKHLELENCFLTKSVTENLGKLLSFCSNLQILIMSNNLQILDGYDYLLSELKHSSKSLIHLDFSACGLTDNQIKQLGNLLQQCNKLEILSIRSCSLVSNGLDYILFGIKSSSATLKTLNLSDCYFTLNQLEYFSEIIHKYSNLKQLRIDFNENADVALKILLNRLKVSSSIDELEFPSCLMDDNSLGTLSESFQKKLNFIDKLDGKRRSCRSLLEKLEKISFEFTNSSKNHGKYIQDILKLCKNLKSVFVSGNESISIGLENILDGLTFSTYCLRDLNLTRCNINENQAKYLGEFLKYCPSLEMFSIKENKKLGSGFGIILTGLENSVKSLKRLNFSECDLSERQSTNLGEFLSLCSNLTSINLDKNRRMGSGIVKIFKEISQSSKYVLKEMHMTNCDLTESQAKSLGDYLKIIPNIEYISIRNNRRLGAGLLYICNGLKESSRLPKILQFDLCDYSESQVKYLEENLKIFLKADLLFHYTTNKPDSKGRTNKTASKLVNIPGESKGFIYLEIA